MFKPILNYKSDHGIKVCLHVTDFSPSFAPFNGPFFWISLQLIKVFTLKYFSLLNRLNGLKPIFLPVFLRVATGTKSSQLFVVKLLQFNKYPEDPNVICFSVLSGKFEQK